MTITYYPDVATALHFAKPGEWVMYEAEPPRFNKYTYHPRCRIMTDEERNHTSAEQWLTWAHKEAKK